MAVKTSENVLVLWFFPIVKTAVKRMQSSKLEQLRYTLTKIVRTFWLAERPVFMRVCKHSCDVKMFCCALANHASIEQARIWKRFLIWEVYNIYPFPHRLKLEKSLQTHCVNFFRLSWHFKREKSVLWKVSFLQNKKLITRTKRSKQHFATGKNFSFNQCHKQRFLPFFSSGKLCYKSNWNFSTAYT